MWISKIELNRLQGVEELYIESYNDLKCEFFKEKELNDQIDEQRELITKLYEVIDKLQRMKVKNK